MEKDEGDAPPDVASLRVTGRRSGHICQVAISPAAAVVGFTGAAPQARGVRELVAPLGRSFARLSLEHYTVRAYLLLGILAQVHELLGVTLESHVLL